MCFEALRPYGVGVATGEHCQNRVVFKQLLQSNALQYCQIDSCRLAGPNEILPVYLMAAKFNGETHVSDTSNCSVLLFAVHFTF